MTETAEKYNKYLYEGHDSFESLRLYIKIELRTEWFTILANKLTQRVHSN